MRILPVCLYYIQNKEADDREAVEGIHLTSGLTHNHLRSQMACGLYYFMAKEILQSHEQSLNACLQQGIDAGLSYYRQDEKNHKEMGHYRRLADLDHFAGVSADEIRSTGYVVDSLEAAVWCLLTTETLRDCLLKAVNLGDDTDTVAAIAGGLAGLYYGYESIPADWMAVIKEKDHTARRHN